MIIITEFDICNTYCSESINKNEILFPTIKNSLNNLKYTLNTLIVKKTLIINAMCVAINFPPYCYSNIF